MHAPPASDEPIPRVRSLRACWTGTLRFFVALFLGRAGGRHNLEVQTGLTKLLYSHTSNVLLVGLTGLLSGFYAYVRDFGTIVFPVAMAGFVLVLIRCGMIRLFQHRLQKKGCLVDPDPWVVGYGLTACGSSVCWGIMSFACLAFSHDPVLYLVSVVFTTATAGSIAARNAPAPRIGQLQLVISLGPVVAGAPFADDRGYLFLDLAVPALVFGLFALIAEINKHLVDLHSTQAKLRHLSNTDYLTQIANRRYFGECFSATLGLRRRSAGPVTVLMIDVDWFKGYNDYYGHPAGDRCLQEIACRLQLSLRDTDSLVSRYGGEEFAVMLRDMDVDHAKIIAQRLCDSIAEAGLPHLNRNDDVEIVTISVGIAATDQVDIDYDAMMTSADQALYLAKTLGRNRVCLGMGSEAGHGVTGKKLART